MKKTKLFIIIIIISFSLFGCSSDSSSSGWAMTAKVNGVLWEMNNFENKNEDSDPLFTNYPHEDFIALQGRYGGISAGKEINMWIKRTDLVVGTYNFTHSDALSSVTYADIIDLSTSGVDTVSGSITITEINTSTKMVKGTFAFTASENPSVANPVISHTVTEGTFNYHYDVWQPL